MSKIMATMAMMKMMARITSTAMAMTNLVGNVTVTS